MIQKVNKDNFFLITTKSDAASKPFLMNLKKFKGDGFLFYKLQ